MIRKDVEVDRLRPGVFIELDLPWHQHPFLFNKFKIKDDDDIAVLKEIGLTEVRVNPNRSDAEPLPRRSDATPKASAPPRRQRRAAPLAEDKKRRIARLRVRRERFRQCDQAFQSQIQSARTVVADLKARPQQALDQASALVGEMTDVLSADSELMVHLMNDKEGQQTLYFHALNVAVLAMLLARSLKADRTTLHAIGLGALFHDVGQQRIPHSVLHKRGPWNHAERDFVEQHPRYGVDTAKKIKDFPKDALTIIGQHHEACDGSGYPNKLTKDEIAWATRVVQVANVYDNHCNPTDPRQAKSPHQALSHMLAFQSEQLDAHLIQVFIKSIGIYPPGTIVRLSNDMIGIVIGVDDRDLLRPSVMVYDPNVPKSEAVVADLYSESDLSISDELSPNDLTPEVINYLSPRTRVSYYFDSPQGPKRA